MAQAATQLTIPQVRNPKIGARLTQFLPQWEELTSDPEILDIVSGMHVDIDESSLSTSVFTPHQPRMSLVESALMDDHVQELQDKAVTVHSDPEPGQFVSPTFLVLKKHKGSRMILNLKVFNTHVEFHSFKMDTLRSILDLVRPGVFMVTLDLKDAYYTIGIHPSQQKFFKFIWRGQLYKFVCAANGLSPVPRKFTKLMKVPMSVLRARGHTVANYLDDIYVQDDTWPLCKQTSDSARSLLTDLGFFVHDDPAKAPEPSQKATVLGSVIDSITMTVSLTTEKQDKIVAFCKELLSTSTTTIRHLAKVIGTLAYGIHAVKFGMLHYRHLERAKITALRSNYGNFDAKMPVTGKMHQDLRWWLDNVVGSFNHISWPNPEAIISTDACTSVAGWGASFDSMRAGGTFTVNDINLADEGTNINVLELLGALYGLRTFQDQLSNRHVLIKSDNSTTVAYIKHMGGTKSECCDLVAHRIWDWAYQRNVWLSATHIPGVINTVADEESRNANDRTEWTIHHKCFSAICGLWGVPEVDLFASLANTRLPSYMSFRPDVNTAHVDAFTTAWNYNYIYCFPPFSLMTKVLKKIQHDQVCRALVVCPLWPSQVWFPTMMSMLVATPRLLPCSKYLLHLPHKPDLLHPLHPKLQMIACLVSGMASYSRAFRETLPTCSWHHGHKVQGSSTPPMSSGGKCFVIRDRLIQPSRLSMPYLTS